MSNGYPMGVVVGSRDAMELAGRMFISSSLLERQRGPDSLSGHD